MRTQFSCISELRVASRPRVKLAGCKSALHPTVVYSPDRSKAAVPVLIFFFVALWFILQGDLLEVLLCVILFLCFSVLLALFGFVWLLFLLVSGKGCGLWMWHFLDISLTVFELLILQHTSVTAFHDFDSVWIWTTQSTVLSLVQPVRDRMNRERFESISISVAGKHIFFLFSSMLENANINRLTKEWAEGDRCLLLSTLRLWILILVITIIFNYEATKVIKYRNTYTAISWKWGLLCGHYESTPIQIYWKLYHKKWNFQMKNSDIFSYFCSKHRLWYSVEPPWWGGSTEYPQSMSLRRNK